jgi:hypothetical protein
MLQVSHESHSLNNLCHIGPTLLLRKSGFFPNTQMQMANSTQNGRIELASGELEGLTLCDSTEMSLAPSEMPFTIPKSMTGSRLPGSF